MINNNTLPLQHHACFICIIIYLGVKMTTKKSKKKTKKLDSKCNKSRRNEERLQDLPYDLRGLSNNRWGGHKTSKLRGFRGSTYGAASNGTTFTEEQLEADAEKHGFKVSERRND